MIYFFNITHFLMRHDVFYLPLSVAKISSRCLHPGKYTLRVTKIITNKNFCILIILFRIEREIYLMKPWEHSSVVSQQLDKWQRVLAQWFEILADASGFVWLLTPEYCSTKKLA